MPAPQAEKIADYVVAHHAALLSLYGREAGVRQARKHLGWYLDRCAPQAGPVARHALLTATEPAVIEHLLRELLAVGADHSRAAA